MFKSLAFLMLPLLLSLMSGHAAAAPTPTHRLEVIFTPEGHSLQGRSLLEIPPGQAIRVSVAGLQTGKISVDGVGRDPDPNGELPLPPSEKGHIVDITFTKTISPDAGDGGGMIAANGIALFGRWHPILDSRALFILTATVPKEFQAVSEAERIESMDVPSGRTFRFHFPHPLDSLNFVAGPYIVEEAKFSGGRTLYSYFFPEDRDLARGYREKTLAYIDRFEKLIGPFPYERFSIVENRLPTGFAMPTFTLLGQAVVRLPFIVDTSLGHEVLHQWFGNSVEPDAASGNWSEGLTAYLADHAFAEDQGQGAVYRKEQLIRYGSYIRGEAPLTLREFRGARGHLDIQEEAARAVGYSRSAMVFHMLRRILGDEPFRAALTDFYTRKRHQEAGWEDLRASFEKVYGNSLADFFNQWLDRRDIPAWKVKDIKTTEEDGASRLTFRILQETETPYRLAIPIMVKAAAGSLRKVIETDKADQEVSLLLPDEALDIVLDPDYDLMRSLTRYESPAVWSRFAGAPAKIAIIDPALPPDRFAPMTAFLEEMGVRTIPAAEATDKDVAQASVIFLGTGSPICRSLFAGVSHPEDGFTVDVRANPLNPRETAVLISASAPGQVARAAGKLRHYGKYSFLHFTDGRAVEKKIQETERGDIEHAGSMPPGAPVQTALPFEAIMDRAASSRVVHVGETHTSYADHELQLRVVRAQYFRNPNLAIGMEMFNRSSQKALDDFLAGVIDEKTFLQDARYFTNWSYDYRLYRDILNFARANHIPVLALNQEKDTTSKVFRQGGLAALSEEERAAIPPDRDLDLPGYRDRLETVFSMHGERGSKGEFKDFIQSQALWDETMAETAADYLLKHPDVRMVVLAGRGHVMKDSAIPPRLARRLPVDQTVLVNAASGEFDPQAADFIIFTPEVDRPGSPTMGVMLQAADKGMKITGFSPHGAAKDSGLQENDIIVSLDGQEVRSFEEVKIVLLYKNSGESIKLRVLRPQENAPDEELEYTLELREKMM